MIMKKLLNRPHSIFRFIFNLLIIILIIFSIFILKNKEYKVKFIFLKTVVSDTTSENNKRYIQNMWTFSGNDDTECMLWWTIIRNNNDLKYMPVLNNISLDEVNFDKYNVVICINRKINKICYHKEPQFPFIPKTPTTATIHFNVHEELNTIFVYLIKKEEPLRVDYKLPMKSQCIID